MTQPQSYQQKKMCHFSFTWYKFIM